MRPEELENYLLGEILDAIDKFDGKLTFAQIIGVLHLLISQLSEELFVE